MSVLATLEALGGKLTSTIRQDRMTGLVELAESLNANKADLKSDEIPHIERYLLQRLDEDADVLLPALRCLYFLISAKNVSVDSILNICRHLLSEVHTPTLPVLQRQIVYSIIEGCLSNHSAAIQSNLGADFTLGFIQAIDGEGDPRNLLLIFRLIETVASSMPIGKFCEEFSEVVLCYFPIDFSPPPADPYGITREQLASRLQSALLALSTPEMCRYILPDIFEKLSSETGGKSQGHLLDMINFMTAFYEESPSAKIGLQYKDTVYSFVRRLVSMDSRPGSSGVDGNALKLLSVLVKCIVSTESEEQAVGWITNVVKEISEAFDHQPIVIHPSTELLAAIAEASSTSASVQQPGIIVLKILLPKLLPNSNDHNSTGLNLDESVISALTAIISVLPDDFASVAKEDNEFMMLFPVSSLTTSLMSDTVTSCELRVHLIRHLIRCGFLIELSILLSVLKWMRQIFVQLDPVLRNGCYLVCKEIEKHEPELISKLTEELASEMKSLISANEDVLVLSKQAVQIKAKMIFLSHLTSDDFVFWTSHIHQLITMFSHFLNISVLEKCMTANASPEQTFCIPLLISETIAMCLNNIPENVTPSDQMDVPVNCSDLISRCVSVSHMTACQNCSSFLQICDNIAVSVRILAAASDSHALSLLRSSLEHIGFPKQDSGSDVSMNGMGDTSTSFNNDTHAEKIKLFFVYQLISASSFVALEKLDKSICDQLVDHVRLLILSDQSLGQPFNEILCQLLSLLVNKTAYLLETAAKLLDTSRNFHQDLQCLTENSDCLDVHNQKNLLLLVYITKALLNKNADLWKNGLARVIDCLKGANSATGPALVNQATNLLVSDFSVLWLCLKDRSDLAIPRTVVKTTLLWRQRLVMFVVPKLLTEFGSQKDKSVNAAANFILLSFIARLYNLVPKAFNLKLTHEVLKTMVLLAHVYSSSEAYALGFLQIITGLLDSFPSELPETLAEDLLSQLCTSLKQQSNNMAVRFEALQILTNLAARTPDHICARYQNAVLTSSQRYLDDRKRVVRRAAANCRSKWSLRMTVP